MKTSTRPGLLGLLLSCTALSPFFSSDAIAQTVAVSGELKQWHKVTLALDGPATSETATPNPYRNFRMNVTFTHPGTGLSYTVPGYFAADGNAANTSATSGNKWHAHLSPDHTGTWNYTISFRSGTDVATDPSALAGSALAPYNNVTGTFTVIASDKTGRDFRAKGRLGYVGDNHLRFANGEWFLKAGPDSPENTLAYGDIDDTPNVGNRRKTWSPHAGDFPAAATPYTWSGNRGTEFLGAINYLANEGLNVFSFLTFSLDGDDDNVFPHLLNDTLAAYQSTADNQRWAKVHHDRFDVSKMAQWEKLFEYAQLRGLYLHFKLQETENDQKMDGGALGVERRLYYREMIARYGHHLALNWNIGEENTNTTQQRKDFAQFFYDNDPYRHHIVLHTFPSQKDSVYTPLLGSASKYTGLSLQSDPNAVVSDTLSWVNQSNTAGRPWVVANDEQGTAQTGITCDSADAAHNSQRKNILWGHFMAGGAGHEAYYGYQTCETDLTAQDHRTRANWWDQCRYALEFFYNNNVPFAEMSSANGLITGSDGGRCLAKTASHYVVQLPNGGTGSLNLSAVTGNYEVKWYNPRAGGALQNGSVTSVTGGGSRALGNAPSATTNDWIVLVRSTTTQPPLPPAAPSLLTASATSSNTISLTWTDNANNEDNFDVQRSLNGSSGWTTIATPTANATGYNDSGLTAATTYFYRVRSANSGGTSAFTANASATTQTGGGTGPTPVAVYTLNGNVLDSVGTNNGTNNGATFSAGIIGQAADFDGVADRVNIPRTIGGNFTIAFWVKTTTTGGGTATSQWFAGKGLVDGEVSGVQNDFGVSLVGGQAAFGVGNPDTTIRSTSTINNGAWRHVAVTRNSTTGAMQLYVDGVLEATATGPTGARNAPPTLAFGSLQTNATGKFLAGSLDDVRLYTSVLTAAEIQDLATP